MRNTISLGVDADTLAAIAGPISEAMHGIAVYVVTAARVRARPIVQVA